MVIFLFIGQEATMLSARKIIELGNRIEEAKDEKVLGDKLVKLSSWHLIGKLALEYVT